MKRSLIFLLAAALAGCAGPATRLAELGTRPDAQALVGVLPVGIAVSPDGRQLAVGGSTAFKVQRVEPGKFRITLESGAPASEQDKIVLLDAHNLQQSKILPYEKGVGALAYSSDGRRLHVLADKGIETVDAASGGKLSRHGSGYDQVAFAPDGSRALGIRAKERTIELVDLEATKSMAVYPMPTGDGKAVTSGSRHLYVHLKDGQVMLHDLVDRSDKALIATKGSITAAVAAPDGRSVAVGTSKGELVVADLEGDRRRVLPNIVDATVSGLCFSSDSRTLAYVSIGGAVLIWDLGSGSVATLLGGDNGPMLRCAWRPGDSSFIVGQIDGIVRRVRLLGTDWSVSPASPTSSAPGQGLPLDRSSASTGDSDAWKAEVLLASNGALQGKYDFQAEGKNELRVVNPNETHVALLVRSGERGSRLWIPARSTRSIRIADGRYDVFFVYDDHPEALFQGDSVSLRNNGVEIRLVRVVDGNYGLRRVR